MKQKKNQNNLVFGLKLIWRRRSYLRRKVLRLLKWKIGILAIRTNNFIHTKRGVITFGCIFCIWCSALQVRDVFALSKEGWEEITNETEEPAMQIVPVVQQVSTLPDKVETQIKKAEKLKEEEKKKQEELKRKKEKEKAERLRALEAQKQKNHFLGYFTITYYCSCPLCNEQYGNKDSQGNVLVPNQTIAVDPNIIPQNVKIKIKSHAPTYIASDVGGGINGNRIDIYVSDHETAEQLGVQYNVPVYQVE